ncbi:MAG: phage tail protein [Hydrogeniiclostridium sp.]
MNTVYFDEVAEQSLERAEKLLAGIPDGVRRAVRSALSRAAQHGLTVGMRIVSGEYAIGQNELKSRTKQVSRVIRDDGGGCEITFGYHGAVIPLLRFDTRVGSDGRIHARVLRSSARQLIPNAFVARVQGQHTGVFVREGAGRNPIHELFGPSAVAAFYAHEETVDKMDEEIRATYEKRVEHEITRILNGWGGT